MDSIEERNKRIEKQHKLFVDAIIVKKLTNSRETQLFLVIKATEEQCTSLVEKKRLPKELLDKLIELKYIDNEVDVKTVLFYGELDNFTAYSNLVYSFPLRRLDIKNRVEPSYRDYTMSLQEQKDTILIFNTCPTAVQSWKSIVRILNTKIGIVIKVIKKK